jgi:hypothetical protein
MKYIIFVGLAFSLVSCYRYNTGVVQKSEQGYIKFIGSYDTLKVVIDNGESIVHRDKNRLYQVLPGNHEVKVYRNDKLVVDRVLFIDDKMTMEVNVP